MRSILAVFLVAAAAGAAVAPGKATATPVSPQAKPADPPRGVRPLIAEAPQPAVEPRAELLPRVDFSIRMAAEPVREAPKEPEPVINAVVDHSAWDALAACESGGWTDDGFVRGSARWDASGDFDGGLQFAQETWLGFRSDDDPWVASDATREVQIRVAQKVLARQGANAWPTCSAYVNIE